MFIGYLPNIDDPICWDRNRTFIYDGSGYAPAASIMWFIRGKLKVLGAQDAPIEPSFDHFDSFRTFFRIRTC
jgi:hypothetical protein